MPYFASGDSSVMKRGSIRLWGWISHPELCHSLSVSFLYPACKPNGVEDVIWNNILHVTLVTTVTKNISNKQATLRLFPRKKYTADLMLRGPCYKMLEIITSSHFPHWFQNRPWAGPCFLPGQASLAYFFFLGTEPSSSTISPCGLLSPRPELVGVTGSRKANTVIKLFWPLKWGTVC